jgi:hypothetical protein
LIGDNPILYVHPRANDYANFNEIISNDYVKKTNIPFEIKHDEWGGDACTCYPVCDCIGCDCRSNERAINIRCVYPNDFEDYLKPLDVV